MLWFLCNFLNYLVFCVLLSHLILIFSRSLEKSITEKVKKKSFFFSKLVAYDHNLSQIKSSILSSLSDEIIEVENEEQQNQQQLF